MAEQGQAPDLQAGTARPGGAGSLGEDAPWCPGSAASAAVAADKHTSLPRCRQAQDHTQQAHGVSQREPTRGGAPRCPQAMRGLALNLGDTGRQHQGALGTVKDAQATVGEDEAPGTKNPAGKVPPADTTRISAHSGATKPT